jgi:thioredoxin 2
MIVVCPSCAGANRLDPERARDDPVCGKCGAPLLDGNPSRSTTRASSGSSRATSFRRGRLLGRMVRPVPRDGAAVRAGGAPAQGHRRAGQGRQRRQPAVSSRLAIRSIPTLVLFRAGKEVKRQAGAVQAAQIVAWVRDA